ncbi:MAG: DUF2628 domain-containing protein [Hyphomicrobiaceae bacterium]|nr:DUF2628 domain-containing protein [Hyphomicrobiaceae bacterium]
MIVFTAHEPAVPKPDALDRAESIVFVREGFSVWAAVFGPLWCLVNGLWIVLAGLLAITLGLTALVGLLTSAPAAGTVVSAALNLVFGFEANNLKRWTLSRKGYRTVGVVAGANAEDCERRFFDAWIGEARRSGPVLGGAASAFATSTTPSIRLPGQRSREQGVIGGLSDVKT